MGQWESRVGCRIQASSLRGLRAETREGKKLRDRNARRRTAMLEGAVQVGVFEFVRNTP